ncbi:MAG: MSMEG_0570 family nitrogen starvation response protein [Panacagrimonas sp.]
MPEIHFQVRWPDESRQSCYSPSSHIKEFFAAGQAYPLAEFLDRSRRGLAHASERVRERYGYACSSAAMQLEQIERIASGFAQTPGARVTVESFHE